MPTLNRSRRLVRVVASCGVAMLVLGGVACSNDAPDHAELVSSLTASGVPKDAAECAADALEDNLTDQELADIAERGGGAAPADDPKSTDDTMDQLRAAMDTCRAMLPTTTTTVTTTLPITGGTSTTLDDGAAGDGASFDTVP